ncbi:hypothetical protein T440DRAFT_57520 [Plenodomus tracheiphilus IPT5]|uniref:Uncharacterized protein n=1 Tax=Plenodomus tracheiphilus IPT5 TaxID=1408161 RepID=A0A6A7BBN8_9PLEO|nr:hypothetical protein T440DRAFT_57520 [Plenodomus tracheiphilus IPT5]
METITNIASTAANTASKLIYGEQPKDTEATTDVETKTATNETGGKEPISGEQGKGTATEPYDQGNLATPLATADNKSTFLDYKNNETGGREPISGEQGKGTVSEPFDQGNDDGPQDGSKTQSSGDPKIYTSREDATYVGMPIVPLNPDVATSGTGASTSTPSAIGTSTITDKAGTTDKVWKDTPLDDISRSGAPGAGPSAPAHVTTAVPDSNTSGVGSTVASPDPAIKTTAADSVTAASDTYSSDPTKTTATPGVGDVKDSKVATENTTPARDGTPTWTDTGVPSKVEPSTSTGTGASKGTWMQKTGRILSSADGVAGIAEESHGRKSETGKSPALATSPSNEEKSGKMSHLKEKLKDKLHIGSKDK